jgi:hypothetical protein
VRLKLHRGSLPYEGEGGADEQIAFDKPSSFIFFAKG